MQLPVLDKSVFTVQLSLSSEDARWLQIACFLCFDSCCFAKCTPREIWKNSFQRRNLSVLRGWASIICGVYLQFFAPNFLRCGISSWSAGSGQCLQFSFGSGFDLARPVFFCSRQSFTGFVRFSGRSLFFILAACWKCFAVSCFCGLTV